MDKPQNKWILSQFPTLVKPSLAMASAEHLDVGVVGGQKKNNNSPQSTHSMEPEPFANMAL